MFAAGTPAGLNYPPAPRLTAANIITYFALLNTCDEWIQFFDVVLISAAACAHLAVLIPADVLDGTDAA